jgi:hypothetical protein
MLLCHLLICLGFQITPPTKNGHAPPPIESRKIFNLSILTMSGPGKFSRVESNYSYVPNVD